MLGFVGDLGAERNVHRHARHERQTRGAIAFALTADYGTKFIIVAGLLNFISPWQTPTISPSGRNNEKGGGGPSSFRTSARDVCVCAVYFYRLRHHASRETKKEMVRYGLYCFAMFLGSSVLVAGWAPMDGSPIRVTIPPIRPTQTHRIRASTRPKFKRAVKSDEARAFASVTVSESEVNPRLRRLPTDPC